MGSKFHLIHLQINQLLVSVQHFSSVITTSSLLTLLAGEYGLVGAEMSVLMTARPPAIQKMHMTLPTTTAAGWEVISEAK